MSFIFFNLGDRKVNHDKVLDKWRVRAKDIQDCHYDTAATLKSFHYATGIPLVILSAVSASNILADKEILTLLQPASQLTASFIALLVTVLASIQTFLGFEKRSELHYKAGVKYGEIKRRIEIMEHPDEKALSELGKEWNALTAESPVIPLRIWNKNEKKKTDLHIMCMCARLSMRTYGGNEKRN